MRHGLHLDYLQISLSPSDFFTWESFLSPLLSFHFHSESKWPQLRISVIRKRKLAFSIYSLVQCFRYIKCQGLYPEVEMPSLQYVMSDEPVWVYIFHMMKNLTHTKKNSLKNCLLDIWSSRDKSIYGRINIVKTLAISKLTFRQHARHSKRQK